jgi:hypothetical protein
MLSHECLDSSQTAPRQEQQPHAVTVAVTVSTGRPGSVTKHAPRRKEQIDSPRRAPNAHLADMAREADLLECPMCDFTVLPTDDYILQLHFEQVHTTDSPFIIENDAEPPLPTQKPRPASNAEETPSSDDEDSAVTCPEPDCGELVPLIDFNDHLDFHAAESLSFDETTGKYRSHHSSATMQTLTVHPPHAAFSKNSFADYNTTMNPSEASNEHRERGHKLKKRSHRHRSDTTSSEKSTLSRSIQTFNPFTKPDKSVKPPNKSARLGASFSCIFSPPPG